jgi:acetate kinase
MRVLVVNAGSSSLKLSLLDDADNVVSARTVTAGPQGWNSDELASFCRGLHVDAVGHRVVHGGDRFLAPVRVDARVRAALEQLTELAPLHQPKSLAGMDAVTDLFPEVPSVACFDTAFHATMPAGAATYALPREWRDRWSLRRYGFHGLSHAWASRRVAELLGRSELRIVVCHLGAGASLCAVRDGRSVDTTMGFTPLEGLVMATRSGSVDPGLVLWVLERTELDEREVAEVLEHRSGLLGLAGTADMREVEAGVQAGDETATLAMDVYVHRAVSGVGSMAAAMNGIDALAFTGGVGERSPFVRAEICSRLGFLGVELDEEANTHPAPDGAISSLSAPTPAYVVQAREDVEVARGVRAVLSTR